MCTIKQIGNLLELLTETGFIDYEKGLISYIHVIDYRNADPENKFTTADEFCAFGVKCDIVNGCTALIFSLENNNTKTLIINDDDYNIEVDEFFKNIIDFNNKATNNLDVYIALNT